MTPKRSRASGSRLMRRSLGTESAARTRGCWARAPPEVAPLPTGRVAVEFPLWSGTLARSAPIDGGKSFASTR